MVGRRGGQARCSPCPTRRTSGTCSEVWSDDPNYSHGFLVVPIALFMLWRRLERYALGSIARGGADILVGWAALAAVLAIRFVAYEQDWQWVETATLLPTIFCLTWTFGGGPLLQRAWPAILFLAFMLPLPNSVNELISLPLQRIAATGSYFILQLSGFWAVQQGNIIDLQTATAWSRSTWRRPATG